MEEDQGLVQRDQRLTFIWSRSGAPRRSAEGLGGRIRKAKMEKLPYVLVVGNDDVEHGTVGVNARGSDAPERDISVDDFVDRLAADVTSKT